MMLMLWFRSSIVAPSSAQAPHEEFWLRDRNSYQEANSKLVHAERLLQVLLRKPVIDRSSKELVFDSGNVEFQNVNFTCGDRKPLLRGMSFTARPGETIAYVGETGSEKSTILKLLFR